MCTVHRCRSIAGVVLASVLVAMAIAVLPVAGASVRPIIEIRHNVLMIDREFERVSIRPRGPSRPGFVIGGYQAPGSRSEPPRHGGRA